MAKKAEELNLLAEDMSEWLRRRPHSRITDIRKKLKELSKKKYPSLAAREWSNGSISALKTKLGFTKHSLKAVGNQKAMQKWLKQKEGDAFSKVTTATFKAQLKKISKKHPTRTQVREMRRKFGYDVKLDSTTKSLQKWVKSKKET